MRTRILLAAGILALCATFVAVPAFTEEEPPAPAPAAGNPMEYYARIGTPCEEHRWLDFMVGNWKTTTKYWMGPGDPQVSEGTAKTAWIFDKHYLRSEYTGSMMDMPFKGEQTLAYSVAAEAYELVWIDGASTGIMHAKGKRDGDAISMTLRTHTHFGEIPAKMITTKKSDDEYVFESYWVLPNMGDFKVMEVRYVRAE